MATAAADPPPVGSALTPDHAPKVDKPGPARLTPNIGGAPAAGQVWTTTLRPTNSPATAQGVTAAPAQPAAPNGVAAPSSVTPLPSAAAPGIGLQASYPIENRQVADRLQLLVDLANGNVIVRYNTTSISGSGFSTDLSQIYNNLSTGSGSFGRGWSMSIGRDVGLEIGSSTVIVHGPTGYTMKFTKNANGSYTGAAGANAALTKNADGSWTLKFDKTEEKWSFTSDGFLTQAQNKNGVHIQFTYDSAHQNRLAAIYDPNGRVTTMDGYDAGNRITTMTGTTGEHYGPYTYDGSGNLTSFPDRAGNTITYTYDTSGNLTGITGPDGDHYTLGYDTSRRVTSVTEPTDTASVVTHYAYPASGQTTETDPRGNTSTYYFDSSGRQTKATDPLGHSQSKTWTANNDVASTTNSLGSAVTYGFDGANNPTSITVPTGAKSVVGYTDAAHPHAPTSITDPQGNQLTGVYNATGNLLSTKSVQLNRNTFTYEYNSNGQVTKTTDGEGRITTYGYDNGSHLTVIQPPGISTHTGLAYDTKDRITEVYDGTGHDIGYSYDALDRVVEIGSYDANDNYTPLQYNNFDGDGNLTARYFSATGSKFTYNPRNQVTENHNTRGTVKYDTYYHYDENNNVTDLYTEGGHVNYVYDKANRLTYQAGPPTNMWASYTYDDGDHRTKTQYPSNLTVNVTYDKSGRQTALNALTTGGTKLVDRTYKWTNSANADTALLQSETREGTTYSYTYDALDQLAKQNTTTYTLDKASNLTAAEGRTFTINSAGQVATSGGGTTYTYDAAGNLTTGSSGTLSYSYSNTNQLITATSPNAGTTTTTYDSTDQSQRAVIHNVNGSTTTDQVLDNTALGVSGITTNGARSDYVRDPAGSLIGQVTAGGESLYAVTDYQGSTIALTDTNQTVAAKYTYTPYGTTTTTGRAGNGNPFRWIGGLQLPDNHNDYALGYRQYDPTLARFTQPDPSRQEANPYTYGLANPCSYSDKTGLIPAGCGASLISLAVTSIGVVIAAATLSPTLVGGVAVVVTGASQIASDYSAATSWFQDSVRSRGSASAGHG